jgi:formiminotetrahydrofolate cyclodeaminase
MPDPTSGSFRDLTLDAFVDALASAAPVPGGGSASAAAASLGAGLVAMVASLSEGRPKYAAHADLHRESQSAGRRLAARFLDLADEDSAAYARFVRALKMAKDTDAEREARLVALRSAGRYAAEVPMRTIEDCLELVTAAEALVGRCNVNAASDLNVATLLGEAAARGAAANVLINLPAVDDEAYAADARAKVADLLGRIERMAQRVHAGVRSGETREPLASRPA